MLSEKETFESLPELDSVLCQKYHPEVMNMHEEVPGRITFKNQNEELEEDSIAEEYNTNKKKVKEIPNQSKKSFILHNERFQTTRVSF